MGCRAVRTEGIGLCLLLLAEMGISYLRERKDRDSGREKWQAALGEKGKLHKSPAGDGIG